MIGTVFSRLTVVKEVGRDKVNNKLWLCKCICGEETKVITASLICGNTRSCGCLMREAAKTNISKLNSIKKLNKQPKKYKSKYKSTWYFNTKERRQDAIKNSYKKHKDKIRDNNYRKSYGITTSQYEELFMLQNGLCAICKTAQSKLPKRLNVDHDHLTGKIRGLLCATCNLGIGHFKDNSEKLLSAVAYLNTAQRVI